MELFVDFYLMLQHLLVVDSYFYLVFLCVLLYKCNMPFLPALIVFPLNFVKKKSKICIYIFMLNLILDASVDFLAIIC